MSNKIALEIIKQAVESGKTLGQAKDLVINQLGFKYYEMTFLIQSKEYQALKKEHHAHLKKKKLQLSEK